LSFLSIECSRVRTVAAAVALRGVNHGRGIPAEAQRVRDGDQHLDGGGDHFRPGYAVAVVAGTARVECIHLELINPFLKWIFSNQINEYQRCINGDNL